MDSYFKKYGFPPNFKKGQGSAVNNVTSKECEDVDQTNEESQPNCISLTRAILVFFTLFHQTQAQLA